MKFLDCIEINPTIKLEKGKEYSFIEMANVDIYSREPKLTAMKKYTSGVKFEKGDTVIARIEPCLQNGKGFFAKNIQIGFGSTEFLVFRPKNEKIDTDFLYYLMQTDNIRKTMIGSMTGATGRQRVNNDIFNSIEISLPDVEVQKKIGSILSSYDDLIENNKNQIKLLEEAAMRLYKEWFVRLRFPGYEKAKITDGVPEGWSQKLLKDCIEVNPESISKNYQYTDIQYVDISSVNCGRIEQKKNYKLSDAPGRAKRLAADGDTIWGMVRPNLKAYALVLSPENNDVFSTGFSVLSPKSIPYTFLYCTVTQDSFIGYLVNCTNGSAYPAVKPIHFEEAKILIPESNILEEFHMVTDPMFRKIKIIETQISYLQKARDMLLPKLMSGDVEV